MACTIATPVHAADAPASALAQAPAIATDPATMAKIQSMIQTYPDAGQFMGAVLIAKDGQVVLDKGFGFADRNAKTQITPNTRFYIASMTKQFTAAAILLLEERGKLSINDPIGKHVSGLPASWAAIPLINLLTHTSGIPDWGNRPEAQATQLKPMTAEQMLAFVTAKPLDFVPDTAYAYSNTNYVLLGMAVEKASGQPFVTFLKDNIFVPLGMEATAVNVALPSLKGYIYRPGGLDIETPKTYDQTSALGDSGIVSTTHDLMKWQQGLFGGKLLTPASLSKMITAYKNDRGVNGNNGFGLVVRAPRGGLRQFHHGGALPGFQSTIAWYPDAKLSVILLENVEARKPAPSAEEMRGNIVTALTGGDVPPPLVHKEIQVSPDVLAAYLGTYELAQPKLHTMTITLEDGQLFAESKGAWRFPVYPETPTRFFSKHFEAQFEFVTAADGKVTGLVFHNGGRSTPGVRK
ncbi:serine hydrolase [Asticcacaulis sp. SL142]|uniref:serine hydrolase n=1 Tax=Asticcacaulis sp. SL142 TaxID=2995155 RepID=UPI00226CA607|nr:serine hydrolase [Asticcacaulis sp. SL142]WAC49421.1 serine hydrolase [Asticcacaulis sp. SL142]